MSTREAVYHNLRDAFANLSKMSGDRVVKFPGVTCVRYPSATAAFNMAFVTDRDGLEPKVLRKVQDFSREIHAEWCFVVPPKFVDLIGITMKRVRITSHEAVPEMVLFTSGLSMPTPPPGLEMRPVKTVDELETMGRTLAAGFGDRENQIRFMANKKALRSSAMKCFMGLVRDRPVATSILDITGDIGGIFCVATLPKYRGKGYGEAVVWGAIHHAISRGCRLISLQASVKGYPVYHRMGFRRIFDFEEWRVPRNAPDVRPSSNIRTEP